MVGVGAMRMNTRANTPMSVSGTMPLMMAGRDEKKIVCSIRGKDDTRRFLANLGFVEEAEVQIISELGGNLIVAVKGARVAISRSMASRILVR
jgi:ferrous iron transport protein A